MTPEEYFAAPGFSNSRMKEIEEQIKGAKFKYDPTKAFYIGGAFDAAITQRKVYIDKYLPILDSITQTMITAMVAAFFSNQYCARFFTIAKYQVAKFRNITFIHNGVIFTVLCKCLFDMLVENPATGVPACGADIKSTDAKNIAQFDAACEFFSWTRSRVFYMLVAGTDRDAIIGVSKHYPYNVFIKHIKRGTPEFNKCVREIIELAFYHWALKAK